MSRYDVAVVGTGIVGAATAFCLTRAGARVVAVDRARDVSGATAMSTGMVRVHQPDMELARLSRLGWEAFPRSLLTTTGCVHDVTGRRRDEVEAEAAELRSWGVPCEVVDASALRVLYPDVAWPAGVLAVHEPESGYADGGACRRHYLDGVVAGGGAVRLGVDVRDFDDFDDLDASKVVVATGAGAASDGLLPPLPVREQLIYWQRVPGPVRELPCYVREGTGPLYFRAESGGGVRFGISRDDEALARARVGAYVGAVGDGGAAEMLRAADGYTADGRPVIDALPGDSDVYVAIGFSGGGFKMAPAVGELLATYVSTGTRPEALLPYAVDRVALTSSLPASS